MNTKKSGDPLVDSLTVIWSIIPKQYRSHEYFLNPVEFIDAYRTIIENPPTLDEYREAKTWVLIQYDVVSKSVEKRERVHPNVSIRSVGLLQAGGNRMVLLQQIFFTLMMLFLFVYYRSNIQDYGAGIIQNPVRFLLVNIFGDYTNPCDMILMLINVLIYIVLLKDMAKVFIEKRRLRVFDGFSTGQVLSNIMASDDVVYSPGNTVNWLMRIQQVDAPKIIPTLQRYIVQGIQWAAPGFSESLTHYLSRDHPVMTVGFLVKHLLGWTPTIFSTIVYSFVFKETITKPIANILRSVDPERYANCESYLPSISGGTRKTRKHKGRKRILKSRKRV